MLFTTGETASYSIPTFYDFMDILMVQTSRGILQTNILVKGLLENHGV